MYEEIIETLPNFSEDNFINTINSIIQGWERRFVFGYEVVEGGSSTKIFSFNNSDLFTEAPVEGYVHTFFFDLRRVTWEKFRITYANSNVSRERHYVLQLLSEEQDLNFDLSFRKSLQVRGRIFLSFHFWNEVEHGIYCEKASIIHRMNSKEWRRIEMDEEGKYYHPEEGNLTKACRS